ncbi:hypothetical protein AVEN_86103-1 [Araneus ventricosus]|uniref:Uncharacterized protein n=1 Tax=Araneus ventricosus TaxID=182803 RepID=A0A4Y2KET4_ARAVE|nr:hypothetical protein AVEN_86103-1 [Araneus ventricosus]
MRKCTWRSCKNIDRHTEKICDEILDVFSSKRKECIQQTLKISQILVLSTIAAIAACSLDVITHYSHHGHGHGISTRYFRKAQGHEYGGYGLGYGGYGYGGLGGCGDYGLGYGGLGGYGSFGYGKMSISLKRR